MAQKITPNQFYAFKRKTNLEVSAYEREDKSLTFVYQVDPFSEGIEDNHLNFVDYLGSKVMNISIWDGNSLMLKGQSKLELNKIFRQG
mmetsp:Transcript_35506/g.34534  ORF Transcript_35506/g.34534 Transcript_35506/m.34534 type:complete len:88 (-) Transcript_35506:542-805(-)|eukprot:CAMPEP_0170566934 /NCGR_PEP_ID=MMETSP0211-20121228/80158_1 /TAXON_ID=311385 /ORGANISM="Pseudokeronopsis sp., Strain OXSARD2" /LENGTH=87 /DNA_ID=CAMNT_0010888251 /DNA_START=106 /DNA_END=369 /DNA_ORIENTATION=-